VIHNVAMLMICEVNDQALLQLTLQRAVSSKLRKSSCQLWFAASALAATRKS